MVASKKPRTVTARKLDDVIANLYRVHFNYVTVNMMDLPKIYADMRAAFIAAGCPKSDTVEAVLSPVIEALVPKYRVTL